MAKKRLDYATIYAMLQSSTIPEVVEVTGVHPKNIALIKNIGGAVLEGKPKPEDARTLGQFTPRELMTELANRGYSGKLTYTQTIDITNF